MSSITWYGHAAFRLEHPDVSILIDPFFTAPAMEETAVKDGAKIVKLTVLVVLALLAIKVVYELIVG